MYVKCVVKSLLHIDLNCVVVVVGIAQLRAQISLILVLVAAFGKVARSPARVFGVVNCFSPIRLVCGLDMLSIVLGNVLVVFLGLVLLVHGAGVCLSRVLVNPVNIVLNHVQMGIHPPLVFVSVVVNCLLYMCAILDLVAVDFVPLGVPIVP